MHELGLRFHCPSRRNYRKRRYMALYTRISTRRYNVYYGEAVLCCYDKTVEHWKCTSLSVFIHATSQCRPHGWRRRKHWIETFKLIFNPFSFPYQIYDCVTIDSNVFASIWILFIFSVHCAKEVDWKSTLDSLFQSYVFDKVRNMVVSAHCTVTSNFLTSCQFY